MKGKITGVILAAGRGTRLQDLTTRKPKALIEVSGKPLIEYSISFLKKVGVDNIMVIGGYYHEHLKRVVEGIDANIGTYYNKNYLSGNLYTLEVALEKIENSFLLMNADHIYHKGIAEKVRSQLRDSIIAFTDYDRTLRDDDMKVLANDSRTNIIKISKQLKDYHLGYVGKTFCGSNQLDKYKEAVERAKSIYGDNAVVENVLQVLADDDINNTIIGDISGHQWHEIDFPHELLDANNKIGNNRDNYL